MFTKEVKWTGDPMTRCYIGKGAERVLVRMLLVVEQRAEAGPWCGARFGRKQ